MYDYHFDHPNNQWNVFDGRGLYVCSFYTAKEADDFCKYNNGQAGYE